MKTKFYFCGMWNGQHEIIESKTYVNTGLKYQSVSGACDTEAQLREHCKIQETPCRICGSLFGINYCEPYQTKLKEQNICFQCNFWMEEIEKFNSAPHGKMPVVKGVKYTVCNETNDSNKRWNGFGGSKFRIKFHDGLLVETTNLWSQGDIPERFRDRLPDNAEFITS